MLHRLVELAGIIGMWESTEKATFREADFTGLGPSVTSIQGLNPNYAFA
jgi:hypothetical protein